jgi:nitric oxide reductase activation protein
MIASTCGASRRCVAVLVLMDLSQSTNDFVRGSDKTVLQLTKEATTLLS